MGLREPRARSKKTDQGGKEEDVAIEVGVWEKAKCMTQPVYFCL